MWLNVYLLFGMPVAYQVCSVDVVSVTSGYECVVELVVFCIVDRGVRIAL
jgi:hypothetical protein